MMTDSITEPPSEGIISVYWLSLFIFTLTLSPHSFAESTDILQISQHITLSDQPSKTNSNTFLVSGCDDYPYHDNRNQIHTGNDRLLSDLKSGLVQGLMCLTGQDPAIGKLHPYHHQQAFKLMDLLESEKTKSFQCVQDELFAYAIASSPHQLISSKKIQSILNDPKLTILIDTYRVGGMLSKKLPESAYETFFKMDDEEIQQHLTGKPLRQNGVKRYENLPGLLFHEMVHWLGHLHTNTEPDITFLYDTCCFGGSDFINDQAVNQNLQTRACNILKDDELWNANNYRKARLWKHKEYNELKREIIRHY